MHPAIVVENLGKCYRLGEIGYGSFIEYLQRRRERRQRQVRAKLTYAKRTKSESRETSERFWALRDVSFEVERGQVVGIIGRNGAGKSTLLKILSRITEPTIGRAELYGKVASMLEVGTGFHPELTGRENVYLSGAICGMKRREIDKKFSDILRFSEVGKFINTPVKRYSSGMYVRLAFAVAAHLDSEILIVDEVLSVGDAQFQKKCLGKMGDVSAHGRTVLVVSHNMATIRSLCSTCIWLDGGRIRQMGPTADVVHAYLGQASAQLRVGEMDLRNWPSRYGSGEVRIVSARMRTRTPTKQPATRHTRSMRTIQAVCNRICDRCAVTDHPIGNRFWRIQRCVPRTMLRQRPPRRDRFPPRPRPSP